MRLFLDPVPAWIGWWEFIDGIFEVGAPTWYMSDVDLGSRMSSPFQQKIDYPSCSLYLLDE